MTHHKHRTTLSRIRFTLTVFIEWKLNLKFTYATISDMDKAQIILGQLYKKIFNQDCKTVVDILMLPKNFALLDNLMLLHALDSIVVISFESRRKNICSILRSHGDEKSAEAGKTTNQKFQPC